MNKEKALDIREEDVKMLMNIRYRGSQPEDPGRLGAHSANYPNYNEVIMTLRYFTRVGKRVLLLTTRFYDLLELHREVSRRPTRNYPTV